MTICPGASMTSRGALGREVAVDGRDLAAADRDVELAALAAARVDDLTALDEQIELGHGLTSWRRPL